MPRIDISTTKQIIPWCYAYTIPQIKEHNGWVKIGFTEQDVISRIRQQTQTACVQFNLEWQEKAIFDDGSGDTFRDTDFHAYLQKQKVERKNYTYVRDGIKHTEPTEWFHIEPKIAHKKFKSNRGVLDVPTASVYKLRKEQLEAVEKTKTYFKSEDGFEPQFLWNAKPRFGKTLSSYQLCMELGAKKILIITNRPAIANSWYDDYVRFLGDESGYYFVSQVSALKNKPYVLTREQYTSHLNNPEHRGCIEFVSLADMKGSLYFGGTIDKLKEVKNLEWDVLIVDEAHEGVDTYKTDVALDQIKYKCVLHLSGTPFKALANDKFPENAIFNWTYADEQKAKREWDSSKEEENPYEVLPQLNMFTYQMSEIVRGKAKQGADFNDDGQNEEYAFDLNEFFMVDGTGAFKYNADVDKFLDALVEGEKFPFATLKLRDELKHTFWLLNIVDSAKALARKLKNHPVFKDYEIVLAAGDGKLDDDDARKVAFNKVKEAIQKHPKTITLSVGQLTTGVTIPEWTAVLMLSNVKSPALYMQAAFRAQNPCLFKEGDQFLRKENAYVFDLIRQGRWLYLSNLPMI